MTLRVTGSLKRWLVGFALLAGAGLLGSCPYGPTKPEQAKPKDPPRSLAIGQTEVFEFPADGQWHRSPWLVMNGQMVIMRPLGAAAGLSAQALRFKIAKVPQMVRAEQPFEITMPGPIEFKVERRYAGGYEGSATVEIKRLP